jgi:hypothetical protein
MDHRRRLKRRGCKIRRSGRHFAGRFACVPSMIESLEVEVLYPA